MGMVFREPRVLPSNWLSLSSVIGQYMPGKGWYIDNGGDGLCGSSQLSLMHWSIQVLPWAWSGLNYNVVDHLGAAGGSLLASVVDCDLLGAVSGISGGETL